MMLESSQRKNVVPFYFLVAEISLNLEALRKLKFLQKLEDNKYEKM